MLLSGLYFMCVFASVLCTRNISFWNTSLVNSLFHVLQFHQFTIVPPIFLVIFLFVSPNLGVKNINTISHIDICISCYRFQTSSYVSYFDKLTDRNCLQWEWWFETIFVHCNKEHALDEPALSLVLEVYSTTISHHIRSWSRE